MRRHATVAFYRGQGFRDSRRCSRDTYPESYVTEYILTYEHKGSFLGRRGSVTSLARRGSVTSQYRSSKTFHDIRDGVHGGKASLLYIYLLSADFYILHTPNHILHTPNHFDTEDHRSLSSGANCRIKCVSLRAGEAR